MAEPILENILDRTVEATVNASPQIHIRFQGRSIDVPLAHLDIGALSSDDQIRSAVATHLEVPPVKLQAFAVDRSPSGELTLRPEAVFG